MLPHIARAGRSLLGAGRGATQRLGEPRLPVAARAVALREVHATRSACAPAAAAAGAARAASPAARKAARVSHLDATARANARANNPRRQFLRRKIERALAEANTIAVMNFGDMDSGAWNNLRFSLRQKNISLTVIPGGITQHTLSSTDLSPMRDILRGRLCVATSPEFKLADILKTVKSHSDTLTLLGGAVENRVCNPEKLEGYAQLGDIDTMRAQLVALLNAPAMRLHQALSANQQAFVAALSRIGKAEGEA